VPNPISNTPEFTVSELAFSLKRTVEETFGHVRVRGEPYPGRSNYQLIIDKMELAGAGALMALFEKRKKMLAAEGLFAAERKRELPFMPKTIGVVTSPTGSVIRDILHRIEDRFPSHVLVWPVLVQGDRAAEQINGLRISRGLRRNVNEKKTALSAARLPRLEGVVAAPQQRLDLAVARLPRPERLFEPMRQRLTVQRLPPLKSLLTEFSRSLELILSRLAPALSASQNRHAMRLSNAAQRLRPEPIQRNAARQAQTFSQMTARSEQAIGRKLEQDKQRLAKAAQLLDA